MRRKPLFPPPYSEATGRRAQSKGTAERTLRTVNGPVTLCRKRWHVPDEGGRVPLDQVLGVSQTGVSVGVREMACRLNQSSSSFRKAAENLSRTAQVSLGAEMLRTLVEEEGRQVLHEREQGLLPAAFQAEDCLTESGKSRVYMGCDGVKVPIITAAEKTKRRKKTKEKRRKRSLSPPALPPLAAMKAGADQSYKEFKLVTFYSESGEQCHCEVTRHDHHIAQVLMSRIGRGIALPRADEKVANVDGAPWILGRAKDSGLPFDAIGLDFYHLAEHVHEAGRGMCREADQARAWAGERLHTVKHEGYQPLWERLLEDRRQGVRSRCKRQAMDQLMHYVAERREMIDYPRFLDRGWQIGSGPTEARCKTTTARLKGSAKRWDADNAEAVAALAALEDSNQWHQYWPACIRPPM